MVVDQNREIVEKCRQKGSPQYGAMRPIMPVLIQAHIANASMLVVATPDTLNVRQMISTARRVNPDIETVVRSHNEDEAVLLEQENAGTVFLGERRTRRRHGRAMSFERLGRAKV